MRGALAGVSLCLAASVSIAAQPAAARRDWRSFRGSDSSGVGDAELPERWDDATGRNVEWRIDLPGRGASSPIVVGDRVFLTSSGGPGDRELSVLCHDLRSGQLLWRRTFWATGLVQCHPKMCMATPTPSSDGSRVFALFSCNDIFCLDLDGDLRWLRGLTLDYPNASNSVGMASSPLVVGPVVVVQVENDSESFSAGLDIATGRNTWKLDRPARVNWTSPVAMRRPPDAPGRGPLVVLQSLEGVSGHDPATGKLVWEHRGRCNVIPSVTVAGGTAYVPIDGLTALRVESAAREPRVAWSSRRLRLSTASSVVAAGRLYALSGSILRCADAQSGERIWQLRLKGPISATPVVSRGRLYAFNEKGLGQVVRLAGEKGEVVSECDLGETILATPAIAGGALLVRSDRHLWKISRLRSAVRAEGSPGRGGGSRAEEAGVDR